jgi:hypothetical protein
MTDYADLELGLHRFQADLYTVEMRFSIPGSDTDTRLGHGAPVRVNLKVEELRELQLDPQEYAATLTKALFEPARLQVAFAEAVASAQSQDLPLRLRLLISSSAPELHNLRWELLRNPKTNTPLATDEMILFSRYLSSTDWRPVKLLSRGDLKALIAVANPSDLGNYKLAPIDEAAEIERAQKGLSEIQYTLLPKGTARVTLNTLIENLQAQPCDILYLVCHGFVASGLPILCLENAEGKMERVSGIDFVTRIQELRNRPRLIVLISCQSAGKGTGDALTAIGPRLAEAGVPAVLAMQDKLSMQTAEEFLPVFFRALQKDGQIDRALSVARGAIRQRLDYWIPVLFMRLKSGRLWYIPGFGDVRKGAEKIPALLRNVQRGRCTPILGPGLSESVLGSKRDVARHWAEQYHFPMGAHEKESLPHVAQYLTINQDARFPFDDLEEYLRKSLQNRHKASLPPDLLGSRASLEELINTVGRAHRKQNPQDGYRTLAGLHLPLYISANQDTLIEDALLEAGKNPTTLLCPWNDYIEQSLDKYAEEPSEQNPLVFHLFGRWNEPDSVVLTEDNYFDFLIGVTGNKALIPEQVRQAISDSSLMFLGFQTESWDFRVLFRSILAQPGGNRRSNYAQISAQLEPDDERILEPQGARRYLEGYFGKSASIDLFWGSAEEFLTELTKFSQEVR